MSESISMLDQNGIIPPLTQPQVVQVFSKYRTKGAYHWDALRRHPRHHDCFTATRYAIMLEAARICPGENVLDLGCGDGALTYLAWKQVRGGDVMGVEPEPLGRELAQEMLLRKGAQVRLLSSSSEVDSESQDVILCAEVIEHVPQPNGLLAEIRRILKPGGRAVISTPVRLTERSFDREHIREFFPEEFKQMVAAYLSVTRHELFCPVFAIDLYYWRPWFFLRKGVIRIAMNILSAWFGIYVMRNLSPNNRYYMIQLVNGVKDLPDCRSRR